MARDKESGKRFQMGRAVSDECGGLRDFRSLAWKGSGEQDQTMVTMDAMPKDAQGAKVLSHGLPPPECASPAPGIERRSQMVRLGVGSGEGGAEGETSAASLNPSSRDDAEARRRDGARGRGV
jgi:hypothetical protein